MGKERKRVERDGEKTRYKKRRSVFAQFADVVLLYGREIDPVIDWCREDNGRNPTLL